MKRRNFLLDGIRVAGCAAMPGTISQLAYAFDGKTTHPPVSLKAIGARCGLKIGLQAEKVTLQTPAFAQTVTSNFNLLTPGNELKWTRVHPAPDKYDFADADWIVAFAQKNGLLVHGHNLCWDANNPAWLTSVLTKANARQYLTEHITTVMTRYRGKIESWDVVNEPTVPWSKRPDGLYPGIWLDLLGPEYIDVAFHAAAAADPTSLRVLNTYQVEHATPDHEKGRQVTLLLLQQLLKRGVPIQAIGIESHLSASRPLGGPSLDQFLQAVRGMGLQVLITELDVDDTQVSGDPATRDAAVGKRYYDYLTEVVPQGGVKRVIFWTVSDKYNWLNSVKSPLFQRSDGAPHRTGLVDETMAPKPVFNSVASAFEKLCTRP